MATKLEQSLTQWLEAPERLSKQSWWQSYTQLSENDLNRSVALSGALTRLQGDECWPDFWLSCNEDGRWEILQILAAHLLRLQENGNVVIADLLLEAPERSVVER